MVTVAQLRSLLEGILDDLSCYDDKAKVYCRCNTYGLGSTFISTYDGFIDPYDIRLEENGDDEEEADE